MGPRRRRGRGVPSWLLGPLAVVALALPAPALAEGPNAVQGLPGCDANALPASEDASSDLVPLGFTANFFGASSDGVYVNENGNVTFRFPFGTFTPFDTVASGQDIIAPFWADVSIGTGSNQVTYGQTTVDGAPAFCVNWVNVGYYFQHADKLNSFQLLLVSRGPSAGDFDIIFNYDKILWESGDHSGGTDGLGGTSAAVGYSSSDVDGDGVSDQAFFLPGSGVPGAFLDSNPNTGLIYGSRGTSQLGRYVFEVRNTVTPVFRESVGAGLVSGTVLIREPGSGEFRELTGSEEIPLDSSVDATNGRVGITAATKEGGTQRTEFYRGQFNVDQGGSGRVTAKLEGAKFGSCKGRSQTARRAPKKLARLWGNGKGKSRTKGRRGSGTVRGTIWLTEERCNGTFFKVKKGKLKVRDFKRKKNVTLKRGDSYLAKG